MRPPVEPVVGSQSSITLQLTNVGPAEVSGIQAVHQLGDGLTFVSANTSGGTCDGVTAVWDVGTLGSGSQGNVTIQVQVAETGSYTTSAAIKASNRPDLDPTNNAATEITLTSQL